MSIYLEVNGNRVVRGSLNLSYTMPVKQLAFTTTSQFGFDIGTSVVANLVFQGVATQKFSGKIKSVTRRRPDSTYDFMAEDILSQAVEYWFAPLNIDQGYTWSNIDNIALTRAMLNYASIADANIIDDWTPYPTFQFATGPEPFKITVASSWDTISMINQVTGGFVYADANNKVHISRITNEPSGAPVRAFATGGGGTLKTIEYYRTDENLRNRVVVYGYQGARAEASAVSPYVPAGFYRTAIISTDLIVDAGMAQDTANINLARLNKLTESVILDVLGEPGIDYLQTVSVTDAKLGLSGNWFVFQCEHRIDSSGGYVCRLTCTK